MLWRLGVLTAAVTVLTGCATEKAAPPPKADAALPVRVAVAERRAVPVQIRAIGNVSAYSVVQVKTEVGGTLTNVAFQEGQDVHKGDLLFVLDQRPFQTALHQAEANLARDQAQLRNAQADARRYELLFNQGIIPRQQYDQFRTTAEALEAAVNADRAAVENTRVQLSYTVVRSPIDGRTGNLLVYQGNVVKANDVPLVVINQIQPIFAAFSVPAENLPQVKKYMERGLRVEAIPRDGTPAVTGKLAFIDNAVDPTTGTIQLKATFANESHTLWPGQFVDVVLNLTTQPDAVLIPSQAVQNGQQGQYVFVVKTDSTVETRAITVSRAVQDRVVVSAGLQGGETVVTDGQLRLSPGAKVRIMKQGT